MNDLTKVVKQYKELFLQSNVENSKEFYQISKYLYDSLYIHYDACEEDIPQQHRICVLIDEEVLPKLKEAIGHAKDNVAHDIFNLYQKYLALSSRRILKNFALYIEYFKKKKVWAKTLDTMMPVFHYLDRFATKENFNLMRVSLMPGIGKSYVGNLFIAQSIGNDKNLQVLRITYSDDLVKITTKQTQAIIDSAPFRDIFPRYAEVPIGKIFKTHDKYSFCMCDCEDEYNFFGFTRDGRLAHYCSDVVCELCLITGNS